MTLITDIRARHWQPALGADGIVTDWADITQAVQIILNTPKGADPHRPDFGSDLWRYLDHPIDRAIPHVIRESVEAILRWEPRVSLLRLAVDVTALGQLKLVGAWALASGVAETFEIPLYAQSA